MTISMPYAGLNLYTTGETAGNNIWLDAINALLTRHDRMIGRQQFPILLPSPEAKAYRLITRARSAGSIKSLTTICGAGTATVIPQVNGVSVTATANSASTTETTQAPTANNTFAAGDYISVLVSNVSGCTDLTMNLWLEFTGEPTA